VIFEHTSATSVEGQVEGADLDRFSQRPDFRDHRADRLAGLGLLEACHQRVEHLVLPADCEILQRAGRLRLEQQDREEDRHDADARDAGQQLAPDRHPVDERRALAGVLDLAHEGLAHGGREGLGEVEQEGPGDEARGHPGHHQDRALERSPVAPAQAHCRGGHHHRNEPARGAHQRAEGRVPHHACEGSTELLLLRLAASAAIEILGHRGQEVTLPGSLERRDQDAVGRDHAQEPPPLLRREFEHHVEGRQDDAYAGQGQREGQPDRAPHEASSGRQAIVHASSSLPASAER
jgi:hypothetical protein